MPFDIQGARSAGASDSQIAEHLASTLGFDIDSARKSGASDSQIAEFLAKNERTQPVPKEHIQTKSPSVSLGEYADVESTPEESAGFARNLLEGGGFLAGAGIGLGAAGPPGSVAGAGLGYGIGRNLANRVDELYGISKPQTLLESTKSAGGDILTGSSMEAGGQIFGKALGVASSKVGKVGRHLVGRLTGAGEGAAEEALKGSDAFTRAMRGKVGGEEIVQHAQDALSALKEQRSAAYRSRLEGLGGNGPIDTSGITNKVTDLMNKYGVRQSADGTLDFSRSAVGRRGVRDLKGVLDTVKRWGGKEGDNTPIGLDTLKRQLDDFWSESSKARGFVAELKNEVKNTITKNVPQYSEMTKGYAEATKLIKDIESGLMLRKQGMTGRIVADQTLRRLTSSMRNNFALRRELLEVLGNKGGMELTEEVGGYAMSGYFPLGIAGTGPMMIGEAALAKFVSPKLWPVLAASSPRVSGEFLRAFGRYLMEMPGTSQMVGRGLSYGSMKNSSK